MTSIRRLAALLERAVPPIPEPSPDLEQYTTPAELALSVALLAMKVGGKNGSYADLGAGTCRLAAALALLGAARVVAIELDPRLCSICRDSLKSLNLLGNVTTVCSVLTRVSGPLRSGAVDIVVSNPPFGVQRRGADKEFILYALRLRPRAAVFILKSGNLDFHTRLARTEGYTTRLLWSDFIAIPASMRHHRSRIRRVRVDIVEFHRTS